MHQNEWAEPLHTHDWCTALPTFSKNTTYHYYLLQCLLCAHVVGKAAAHQKRIYSILAIKDKKEDEKEPIATPPPPPPPLLIKNVSIAY